MPTQAPKRLEPKWVCSWVSSACRHLRVPWLVLHLAHLRSFLCFGLSGPRRAGLVRGRGFGCGFPWLWGSPAPSVLPRCAVSRFVLFPGEQTGHGSWAGGAPFCALFLRTWPCALCVCIWPLPFALHIWPFAICAFFAFGRLSLAMVDRPCLVGSSHMAGASVFPFAAVSLGTCPCVCMPVTWR